MWFLVGEIYGHWGIPSCACGQVPGQWLVASSGMDILVYIYIYQIISSSVGSVLSYRLFYFVCTRHWHDG